MLRKKNKACIEYIKYGGFLQIDRERKRQKELFGSI